MKYLLKSFYNNKKNSIFADEILFNLRKKYKQL